MKREKQSGVGIGHRHNHLRASCAMERERLLGAAAPVVEASTSGFARDGVVRTRRDRARLAAAAAALLGCAAFAGSSLSGASVAALGDGGPAQLGVAGAPNAWGTKHNALPWWTRPAAVNARRQASLGMYEGMKEETTFDHLANGEIGKSETRALRADAVAATSAGTSARIESDSVHESASCSRTARETSGAAKWRRVSSTPKVTARSAGIPNEDSMVSGASESSGSDAPRAPAHRPRHRADPRSRSSRCATGRRRRRQRRAARSEGSWNYAPWPTR